MNNSTESLLVVIHATEQHSSPNILAKEMKKTKQQNVAVQFEICHHFIGCLDICVKVTVKVTKVIKNMTYIEQKQ